MAGMKGDSQVSPTDADAETEAAYLRMSWLG